MANEALVTAIKSIIALSKSGKTAESYEGYRALFSSTEFKQYKPEDQRQALKLMILAKGAPSPPSPGMLEAHRAAVEPLTTMVSQHAEPADHEMLGMCHVLLGNEAAASQIFRAGLTLERERNPQSDLCGSLMKRVSLL